MRSTKRIGKFGTRTKIDIDGFRLFSINQGASAYTAGNSFGAGIRRLISSSDSFSRFILVENIVAGDVKIVSKPISYREATSNWSGGLEYTLHTELRMGNAGASIEQNVVDSSIITESADCGNQARSTASIPGAYFENDFGGSFAFMLFVYNSDRPTSTTLCHRNINVGEILILVRESKILGITQNPFFNQLAITELFP